MERQTNTDKEEREREDKTHKQQRKEKNTDWSQVQKQFYDSVHQKDLKKNENTEILQCRDRYPTRLEIKSESRPCG